MYNTSQNYKNYIKEPSRMFESKIILGSRTLNNDDVIQLKTELQQPSNGFTLGSCISKSLELTLNNDGGAYASVGIVNVSLGLKMGELIEYIPQGIFNIDKVEKTDYTVKVTAYDNMIKFETAYSGKYDNPTLKQVIQQLQDITGVEFDSSVTIPSYTLNKLSGYTCREILGYVASLMGGNAYITREGKFTIATPVEVDYTVTSNNYWDYDLEDNTYKIGMLTCQNKLKNDAVDESDDYEAIEEKNTISAGSLGIDNMELTFVNPWMTETILNTVYNKLKSFSFLGYSMKWQGDLSLDVGNIINVIDKHGVTRKALIFSDKLNYNGGLTQESGAKGQTKSSNQFSTVDSPTELDRISVKVLLAEKAIIQKANIADLTAVSAKVGTLDVSIATINTALINKANIDDLNATNANVTNLNAQYANLSNAIINKADIADLNATNANISNLKATVADISTLVSGNLTSANIHSLVLTADKVTVQNGFIKNAMVESLVADKITSGTLNTNKLNIASNDGGLVLANNTIQFSDKDKNVRVQIGQDAKGDFNFIVKGTDGRTVLLDSTGLHEGAISDGLIKTDMIADNSINSNKIDYSSVISGLNADGSNYINASKVAIDLTGQTLDIAFNSVKTIADSANDKIDNLNVGGVNLFTGTKDFSGTWKDKSFWTIDGTKYKNFVVMKSSNQWMGLSQFVPFVKGEKYVLSAYVKCDTGAGVYFYSSEGSVVPSTDNGTKLIGATDNATSWRKIYQAFTITSDGSFRPRFENSVDGKMFYICGLKLEKGNIATDWTPAPEDIENSISDVKSITETNTTSISAIQGQISTLTSNTTVTVDGKEKTLKDAYSGTVQTVNSINTTIGEHTSTLNTLSGTVSSNSSKITSIQTDLNGIKTSVSSVQSDLNSTKSQISSLSSTLDGFESRVEATESNFNNLSIGGRNLLKNTAYRNDITGTYNRGTYHIISRDTTNSYNCNNSLKIECKIASMSGSQDIWQYLYDVVIVDMNVLVSFYIKGSIASSGWIRFGGGGSSGGIKTFSITTDWKFVTVNLGKVTMTGTKGNVELIYGFNSIGIYYINSMKLEYGTKATDWTPAPEDIETYTDTQISSAKSEIKQTTDSISQSVSNINSSITTINSTLGNKAEKSTVESISNSVTSLNTTLNGITGRVSSLETNTTTLTTKLNDLNVGGRNLLINSNFSSNKNFWSDWGAPSIREFVTLGVKKWCHIKGSGTALYQGISQNTGIQIDKNTQYTFSAKVKANSEKQIFTIGIHWCNSINSILAQSWMNFTVSTAEEIIKVVFTSPTSDVSRFNIMLGVNNASIVYDVYFTDVKFEKGAIPTDWTPAPEDVENEITTVQETVTSNTTEISALKNSISLKVDSTTLNSYKDTVNGQINTINSSITSMQSSIDLQLDSIKSSVSKTVSTKNLINNSAFNKELGFINKSGTNYACRISKKSEYTGWGYVNAPVADDNVLYIRYDKGGDNYCEFRDLYGMVKPNTKYTFSYYYTLNGPYTAPSSFLYERNASGFGKITYTNPIIIGPDKACSRDTWIRYSKTFTTGADTDSIMVRFGFRSNDGPCEMLIAGLQLEESSSSSDWVEGNVSNIGTVITQSPTAVKTAFNGISQYFEVSESGAKFGNIATGNYTLFDDNGLRHYVNSREMNYLYVVHYFEFTVKLKEKTIALNDAQKAVGKTLSPASVPNLSFNEFADYYTIEFDDELKELLNGYPARKLVNITYGYSGSFSDSLSSGEQLYGSSNYKWEFVSATSNSATIKAGRCDKVFYVETDKLGNKWYTAQRNVCGSSLIVKCLVLA
ncbi:carbohydrate binding domain-containing protein [Clostridium butyricum]